jgi:hypothetical protein
MLCPAQSPNLHCSHLVAYTPYEEQKSKEKSKNHRWVLYLRLGQKRWRGPAMAELLWHRLQRASYGAGSTRPPAVAITSAMVKWIMPLAIYTAFYFLLWWYDMIMQQPNFFSSNKMSKILSHSVTSSVYFDPICLFFGKTGTRAEQTNGLNFWSTQLVTHFRNIL